MTTEEEKLAAAIARAEKAERRCERLRGALVYTYRRLLELEEKIAGLVSVTNAARFADDAEAGK